MCVSCLWAAQVRGAATHMAAVTMLQMVLMWREQLLRQSCSDDD
jgi:hypothetical protein